MLTVPEKRKHRPTNWQFVLVFLLIIIVPIVIYGVFLLVVGLLPITYKVVIPPKTDDLIQDLTFESLNQTNGITRQLHCAVLNIASLEILQNPSTQWVEDYLQIQVDGVDVHIYPTHQSRYWETNDSKSWIITSPLMKVCFDVTSLTQTHHQAVLMVNNEMGETHTETWQFTKTRPLLPNWGD